jgi:hypothetical protein
MTTVVYRDGVMAGDTAVFDRGVYCGQVTKIFKSPAGSLAAVAGCLGDSVAMKEWVEERHALGAPPEFGDDDSEGLLVEPDGSVFWIGPKQKRIKVDGPFHAIGSGFRIAIGALHAGADAVRAVEIAADVDNHTRRPIVYVNHEVKA